MAVDKIKGDKIKSAIAKSKKSNFDKAFDASPLSENPNNSTTAPKTGNSSASYEVGVKPSGGSGFKDDLDYVAGVASRAAKEAASLRNYGQQQQQSYQTNAISANRDSAVNDRGFAVNTASAQRATDRSNAVLDRSNATAQARAATNAARTPTNYEISRNFTTDLKDIGRQVLSEQELASRAGQTAASLKNQRNNQLLNLARGGL